jgi:hypothetical protein
MSRRRLIAVPVAALLAGSTAASTFLVWFREESFATFLNQTRGFDTSWGKTFLIVACVGAIFALIAGWSARVWLWIANRFLGLSGIGVVVTAVATHQAGEAASTWTATPGYWVSLGLAIGWPVTALATYPARHERGRRWLQRDERPPYTRLTLAFTAAAASAAFLLVGAFGPWQDIGVASRSGLANSQDGMVVLGAAFLALLGLLAYLRLGSRRALLGVLVLAIAAAATSIYDLYDISADGAVSSGWGINLDAEASVALLVSAALLFVRFGGPSLSSSRTESAVGKPAAETSSSTPLEGVPSDG